MRPSPIWRNLPMIPCDNTTLLGKITEGAFDIELIWRNMKNCTGRGIYIHDDSSRNMIYHPFSELYAKAGVYARLLRCRAVLKDEIVLISALTDFNFAISWLACIRLGAVSATLPPRTAFVSEGITGTGLKKCSPIIGILSAMKTRYGLSKRSAANKVSR